jgi:hypothetical protein
MVLFAFALLALTMGFETLSKYATMGIFVRAGQLLMVSSYYEVSWTGSFSAYFRHSNGVLLNIERDVYPISFFPIFTVLNYFAPLLYFPLFETSATPNCPNDANVDWESFVVHGMFRGMFSLDSLGGWTIFFVLCLELYLHGPHLRFQQRAVAMFTTCLPAIATFVVRHQICDLGTVCENPCALCFECVFHFKKKYCF